MSLKEAYIEHIKTNMIISINEIMNSEQLNSSFHDEFSYNDDADLNVTIKFLPGQIQSGVVQYPGEILIEIKEDYFSEVLEALNTFAIDYNEDITTLDSKNYREYYATPNVIGTFQNKGLENYTAISLSFSLISFHNVMEFNFDRTNPTDGNNNSIKIYVGNTTDGNYEVVNFITYAFAYASDNNSSGVTSIYDPTVKQIAESAGTNYTFTFVPKTDGIVSKYLFNQIVHGTPINRKYTIMFKDFDPTNNNSVASIECILFSGSISQEFNGLPIMQVTFTRGDF